MHILEAEHARPLQVRNEDCVVHRRAMRRRLRLEVAYRIEVRYVDTVLVWLGAVRSVLLYVQREEAHI